MQLIKEIQKAGIPIDDNMNFTDREKIDRQEELKYNQKLIFGFKEMKIDKDYVYTLTGSLNERIKADCNYQATLFMSPERYNDQINMVYGDLRRKIRDLYEEMQKGGLFNSEKRIENQVVGIKEHYRLLQVKVKTYKQQYLDDKIDFEDYTFGCGVQKVENRYDAVKRVDFILGREAYTHLAENIKNIDKYNLGLQAL